MEFYHEGEPKESNEQKNIGPSPSIQCNLNLNATSTLLSWSPTFSTVIATILDRKDPLRTRAAPLKTAGWRAGSQFATASGTWPGSKIRCPFRLPRLPPNAWAQSNARRNLFQATRPSLLRTKQKLLEQTRCWNTGLNRPGRFTNVPLLPFSGGVGTGAPGSRAARGRLGALGMKLLLLVLEPLGHPASGAWLGGGSGLLLFLGEPRSPSAFPETAVCAS